MMPPRGRAHRAIALVFACALAAPAALAAKSSKPAPSFSLPGRDGRPVASDSLRGKVVYVDFWASWCGPCRQSFPWLATLQKTYGAQGLEVVAIDLDKDRDDADKFLAEVPAPFTVAFDPAGKTAEAFHVTGMPSSFLLDRKGNILASHVGFDPKRAPAAEARVKEACAP